MILLVSLALDALFIARKLRLARRLPLQSVAMAAVINVVAYYMIAGLTQALGGGVFIEISCALAAKLFVLLAGTLRERAQTRDNALYALIVAIAMCPHENPLTGLVSGLLLLGAAFVPQLPRPEAFPAEAPIGKTGGAEYVRLIDSHYQKARALLHDLNNHTISMRSLAKEHRYDELEMYIDSLSDKVSQNMLPVKTGNFLLDALLADKHHEARRCGIAVEYLAARCACAIADEDLCAVVGNLLDNAIEENKRGKRGAYKFVTIDITSDESSLRVRIVNPCFHEITVRDGLPLCAKPDADHHGIGLRNVRRICDRYGGQLFWTAEGATFEVCATLNMTRQA